MFTMRDANYGKRRLCSRHEIETESAEVDAAYVPPPEMVPYLGISGRRCHLQTRLTDWAWEASH